MPLTSDESKEVLNHILKDVLGIDQGATTTLINSKKITTPNKLVYLSQRSLEKLEDDGDLTVVDTDAIKMFQAWYREQRTAGNIPTTVDAWKQALPAGEEIVLQGSMAGPMVQSSTHTGGVASKFGSTPKISDYPSLTGQAKDWFATKVKFEALGRLDGYDEVLNVQDVTAHTTRFAADTVYQEKCKDFFSILVNASADGPAMSHVLKFHTTSDGALAWKALKEYYDSEGDKQEYALDCLSSLMDLKLNYDSPGGMEQFISAFELEALKIEQADPNQKMSDATKKLHFFKSIQDRDYSEMESHCHGMSWDKTIIEMRKKAKKLGKINGPSRRIRKYNKAQRKNKNKGSSNQNNTKSEQGEQKHKDDEYWIPNDVFKTLSPAVQKHWLEMRKNKTNTSSEGTQYTSKANNVSTKQVTFSDDTKSAKSQNESDVTGPTHKSLFRKINTVKTKNIDCAPESMKRKSDDVQQSVMGQGDKPDDKYYIMGHARHPYTGEIRFTVHQWRPTYKVYTVSMDKMKERLPDMTARYARKYGHESDPGFEWTRAHNEIFNDPIPRRHIKMQRQIPPYYHANRNLIPAEEEEGGEENPERNFGYRVTERKSDRRAWISVIRQDLTVPRDERNPNDPSHWIVWVSFAPSVEEEAQLEPVPPRELSRSFNWDQAIDLFPDLVENYFEPRYRRHPPILSGNPIEWPQFMKAWLERRQSGEISANVQKTEEKPKQHSNLNARQVDEEEPPNEVALLDNGSDTCSLGGTAWYVEGTTSRSVRVIGYHKKDTVSENVTIGTGITAVDLPNNEVVLFRVYEGTLMGKEANTLLSIAQMREAGVVIDDLARRHGGTGTIFVDDVVVPIHYEEALLAFNIRRPSSWEINNLEPIDLTKPQEWHPQSITDAKITKSEYEKLVATVQAKNNVVKTDPRIQKQAEECKKYFLHPDKRIMENTIRATTQVGMVNKRFPFRQHFKSRNPLLQRRRFLEPYATDTWFSTTTSYEGYNCAQIFTGIKSGMVSHYGMKTESDGPKALLDFFRQEGVPPSITRDNSKMQTGELWKEYMRDYFVKDKFIEPHHPNQNPAERMMATQKEKLDRLMILSGCDPRAWFKAAQHVADVTSHTATNNGRTPYEVREGETPDISSLIQFQFWELVYYKSYKSDTLSEKGGSERLGHWMGRALDYGDKMCYWILDVETEELMVRSSVRPINDDDRQVEAFTLAIQNEKEKSRILREKGESSIIVTKIGDSSQDISEGSPIMRNKGAIIKPDDLLDIVIYDKYKTKKGTDKQIRGKVKERVDNERYRVAFDNGKQRIYDYAQLINMANRGEEEGYDMWNYEAILDHRNSIHPNRKGKLDVQIKWEGYDEPTWEPMEVIMKDDPANLAKYAQEKDLLKLSQWKWANRYVKKNGASLRRINQARLMKKKGSPIKYQFGVRVPNSLKEAYELDKQNGNTLWADAIAKEVSLLADDFECFKILDPGEGPPEGYLKIPLLWTFAVKYDGRRRARLVAGGHVTPDPLTDLYSGVVTLESVRIAFLGADLMKLKVEAGDISSAYIQAYTKEKLYTVAGEEFGPLAGRILLIDRALYGTKSAGAMWYQKLADNLRDMGFEQCYADHELWIRDRGDHYEYAAVIVDDLLVFSRTPNLIWEQLRGVFGYTLKGVGIPEYYSGADLTFNKKTQRWEMSAKTYIKSVCEKIEKLTELPLKNYGSPMDTGDHPEMDESDLLVGEQIRMYQMLIGCAQWAVTLGRFDVQYATNTLARFAASPREGHYKRCLRLFGYLKHNVRQRIDFDPQDISLDEVEFVNNEWKDVYPGAKEELPDKWPEPKTKSVSVTVLVDASHATDLSTRRSVTGYIILIGQTPVRWYSKRQNTVESSTYGSELVALRIAVEALIDIRYKLRMMGIAIQETSTVLCDNMSVVTNMQLPSSTLKKKHVSVAYHKARWVVASGLARVAHVSGTENASDLLTKPCSPTEYYKLLRGLLLP